MWKIYAAAVREYKVTALTPAFFIGAVIVPAVIWGLMFFVGATGCSIPRSRRCRAGLPWWTRPRPDADRRPERSFSPEGRARAAEQMQALRDQINRLPPRCVSRR